MTRSSRIISVILLISCAALALSAQQTSLPRVEPSKTLLVLPFENASSVPGIEWIGEAFPEVVSDRFAESGVFVISREDRVRAYDMLGIPVNLKPSRATLYRIAEEMGADFAVLGRYSFDGQNFSASAQVLDVKDLRLGKELTERGPLPSLMPIANALAWDVLHALGPDTAPSREAFLAAAPAVRLDAFEHYVRGITSTSRSEQIRHLKEAVRINPDYQRAIYQLGRAYFEVRDYANATAWLAKLGHDGAQGREGMF